jgi:hypothetical protein
MAPNSHRVTQYDHDPPADSGFPFAPSVAPASNLEQWMHALLWAPALGLGFTAPQDRTAWRYHVNRVDVVQVRSLGPKAADDLGASALSFCISLGIHAFASTWERELPLRNGKPQPAPVHCDLRLELRKAIPQLELRRTDVWFVRSDGTNLTATLADASHVLFTQGMTWFARFACLRDIREFVEHRPETRTGTYGPGPLGSLRRRRLAADLRRALE